MGVCRRTAVRGPRLVAPAPSGLRALVAALVVEAIGEERLPILTHGFVRQQRQRKMADPERWLRGMRQLHGQVG